MATRLRNVPLPVSDAHVSPLRLDLIDGFTLRAGTAALKLPMSVQRLIAYLALQERAVQRPHLAGSLWLDTSEDRAGACLRSALWRLREKGLDVVVGRDGSLALADDVVVDLRDATSAAADLMNGLTTPLSDRALLAFFTRDLLPDWYDDWVIMARERFRQVRLHALEALCRQLVACGELPRAVESGLAAVACEPLRESAHVVLIQAHLAAGNVGEALRQFRFYERLVTTELGVEPSPRIRSMLPVVRSR